MLARLMIMLCDACAMPVLFCLVAPILPSLALSPQPSPDALALRAIPGILASSPADRPGEQQQPLQRAFCQSHTAQMGEARSASPPPAVDWSGSNPAVGVFRRGPL